MTCIPSRRAILPMLASVSVVDHALSHDLVEGGPVTVGRARPSSATCRGAFADHNHGATLAGADGLDAFQQIVRRIGDLQKPLLGRDLGRARVLVVGQLNGRALRRLPGILLVVKGPALLPHSIVHLAIGRVVTLARASSPFQRLLLDPVVNVYTREPPCPANFEGWDLLGPANR